MVKTTKKCRCNKHVIASRRARPSTLNRVRCSRCSKMFLTNRAFSERPVCFDCQRKSSALSPKGRN